MIPCQMCGTLVEIPAGVPAEFVTAARCARHSWVRQPRAYVVTPPVESLDYLREAAEVLATQVPTSTLNAPQTGAQSR